MIRQVPKSNPVLAPVAVRQAPEAIAMMWHFALRGCAFALILSSAPVSAHHSFFSEFHADKPTAATGTITKVEWTNPHGRLFVDVKDASGATANWEFELGSVNGLMRNLGWTRNTLKPGDIVTVSGYMSRLAPHIAIVAKVVLADGRTFMTGGIPASAAPLP